MLIGGPSKDLARSISLAIPQLSVGIRAMSHVKTIPKRFAPLDPQKSNPAGAPPLKGIVFDVDGTLWYAFSNHDFLNSSQMRFPNFCHVVMFQADLYHAVEQCKAKVFIIKHTLELHIV